MKNICLLSLLLMPLIGCASGVNFRPSDIAPDFKRSNAEWRGVMVSGVEFFPGYQRDCFLTKRGENSPGSALACSSDPAIRTIMRGIPYAEGSGAAPTLVRFDYYPMGGDQTSAIGPAAKDLLKKHLEKIQQEEGSKSLETCRRTVSKLDELFAAIDHQVMTYTQGEPDHHNHRHAAKLGQEAASAYFNQFPSSQTETNCSAIAGQLLALIDQAPLTGYLEIQNKLSWSR